MTERMGRVVCDITVTADGYSAGLNQTEQRPFGDDGGDGTGDALHAWMFKTPDENRAEIEKLSSWGATCLVLCAANGTVSGTAGGATIRRSTRRSSC